MKINIILISKLADGNLRNLIEEYKKRISRYAEINFIEFKKGTNIFDIKNNKAKNISGINFDIKNSYVVALSEIGKKYNSLKFAEKVDKINTYTNSNITFIIADSDGFDKKDILLADEILSLSEMTFPHEVATCILFEQIYRAISILNNLPYHRE